MKSAEHWQFVYKHSSFDFFISVTGLNIETDLAVHIFFPLSAILLDFCMCSTMHVQNYVCSVVECSYINSTGKSSVNKGEELFSQLLLIKNNYLLCKYKKPSLKYNIVQNQACYVSEITFL